MSIKQRNKESIERMLKRGQDQLDVELQISVRNLVEFTNAVVEFSKYTRCYTASELTRFLLTNVDFSGVGEPVNILPRYKTFELGGFQIATRDWDNRYEMGK